MPAQFYQTKGQSARWPDISAALGRGLSLGLQARRVKSAEVSEAKRLTLFQEENARKAQESELTRQLTERQIYAANQQIAHDRIMNPLRQDKAIENVLQEEEETLQSRQATEQGAILTRRKQFELELDQKYAGPERAQGLAAGKQNILMSKARTELTKALSETEKNRGKRLQKQSEFEALHTLVETGSKLGPAYWAAVQKNPGAYGLTPKQMALVKSIKPEELTERGKGGVSVPKNRFELGFLFANKALAMGNPALAASIYATLLIDSQLLKQTVGEDDPAAAKAVVNNFREGISKIFSPVSRNEPAANWLRDQATPKVRAALKGKGEVEWLVAEGVTDLALGEDTVVRALQDTKTLKLIKSDLAKHPGWTRRQKSDRVRRLLIALFDITGSGARGRAAKPKGGFLPSYKEYAAEQGLSSDPYDRRHHYNYESYYNERGEFPKGKGQHLSSKFKDDSHPNLIIKKNGRWWNTKTGKYVSEKEYRDWRKRVLRAQELEKELR